MAKQSEGIAKQSEGIATQCAATARHGNATGNFGVNSTLDAQQTLANIAYNKRAQDMQQSQYEQSAKTDQENAMRDYYLKLWEGMGNRGATSQIAAVLGIPVGSVYGAGTYNSNYN